MSTSPESGRTDDYERTLTKRVLWKLDLRILPPLALLWLANFIDRSNVGNARIAGLERDTKLHGNQFNIALAVYVAQYLAASNWVLKKMRPNRWLPLLVFLWGVVTTLSGLVQSFGGLLAVRIFLGFCEGGILPGMMVYLSTIYKRHELQMRVGIFYASASLAGAFGGLLATAIIKMDGVGNLAGWRWIFILEGIATCMLALLAFAVLPEGIQGAKFLTEEERQFALRRFRNADKNANSAPLSEASQRITDSEKAAGEEVKTEVYVNETGAENIIPQEEEVFEWREVWRGVTDIQTWLTGIAYLGLIVSLYSYSLFLPTIVAELGFSGGKAQLHTVPPYVPATVLTIVVAYVADRYKIRGPLILLCLPMNIAGKSLLPLNRRLLTGYILAISAKTNEGRYAAVFLIAAGLYPSSPCILSIMPNNTSGHFKKATASGLSLAIANTGGFVATFIYTQDQAPRYVRGHSIVLGFVCMAWIFTAANVLYCIWENKARAEGRREGNLVAYQELWDAGKTRAPIGDRHPRFRFTL
ncbi:MFS transporter [Dentipellis sp. KUC8613]|nr:MFS transporter [Dentipellis sp. KUC8613]